MDDMELKLAILARGEQAIRVLNEVQGKISNVGKSAVLSHHPMAAMGRATAMTFRGLGSVVNAALAPMRMLAGAGALVGGMLALVAGRAVKAEGDMEALRLRLQGVTATQQDAADAFAQAEKMSIESPFDPTELVEGKIALLNIGQTGEKALRSVGDAAAITQRPIADLVSMLASMETEPLRRIGIEVKRESGKFEFEFRDKMGKVQRIVAEGIGAARESLLSIWDVKYGGGMSRFASAWQGLISTLQGNVQLALARFGQGMMPAAKTFAAGLNARLADLIGSGRLEEMGAKVGDALLKAWDYGRAVATYMAGLFGAMSADNLATAMGQAMGAAGQIIAIGLVNYLRGMGSIFAGLGKIISAAFLEDILALPIPGMGKHRESAAIKALSGMTPGQAASAARGTEWEGKIGHLMTAMAPADLVKGMSREEQARFASSGRGALLQSGVEEFTETLPELARETLGAISNVLATLRGGLGQMSGYAGPGIDELAGGYAADRGRGPGRVMVQAARRVWAAGADNTQAGRWDWDRREVEADAGQYQVGQKVGAGYQVFHITNLRVSATDAQQMGERIMAAAGTPAMAAAGT